MNDEEILDKMRPFLDEADGGYLCAYRTGREKVVAAGRCLLASQEKAEPVAYVDGDDSLRRILWEPDQAAFNLPVGTKLYPAPQPNAEAVRDAALEEAANTATGFLVGDPLAGIPLRNPMAHEIADAIRARKSAPPQPAEQPSAQGEQE